MDLSEREIGKLLDFNLVPIREEAKRLRSLVSYEFIRKLPKFKGTVEIDESCFFGRRVDLEKPTTNKWVFGLYERDTKRTYMELVSKRTVHTLLPIIQKICEMGTTILSDQWKAYEPLSDLGYPHYTVDHSRYFVDPRNREIHTQHIEISWCWAKYFIKRKNRKGSELQDHLNEFCWRR